MTKKKVEPCCPKFDPTPFLEDDEMTLEGKHFVQDTVYSLWYIPLTFGKMTTRVVTKLEAAKAAPAPKDTMMLQRVWPCSPWWAQVYMACTTDKVPNAQVVNIPGKFLTKVYEGPYSDVGKWVKDMQTHVKEKKAKEASTIYAWYTTCPKCIKVHGENHVVLLAQIE